MSQEEVSGEQLKQFVEKIERLEEAKLSITQEIRDVYNFAKSEGLDPKVMRQVIKMRKMDRETLVEMEELVCLYCQALGMKL